MNHSTTRQKTPEQEELARKQEDLAYLETEMAQDELDLATFLAELQAFESRYLRIVGTRMADLDEIDVLRPNSIAGVRVAPQIEKGTGKILGPRRAYVPRVVAEGHPASRVVIVGPAPAGAKIGIKE